MQWDARVLGAGFSRQVLQPELVQLLQPGSGMHAPHMPVLLVLLQTLLRTLQPVTPEAADAGWVRRPGPCTLAAATTLPGHIQCVGHVQACARTHTYKHIPLAPSCPVLSRPWIWVCIPCSIPGRLPHECDPAQALDSLTGIVEESGLRAALEQLVGRDYAGRLPSQLTSPQGAPDPLLVQAAAPRDTAAAPAKVGRAQGGGDGVHACGARQAAAGGAPRL